MGRTEGQWRKGWEERDRDGEGLVAESRHGTRSSRRKLMNKRRYPKNYYVNEFVFIK